MENVLVINSILICRIVYLLDTTMDLGLLIDDTVYSAFSDIV